MGSKVNFGKYAITQPVEHRFEQEPDWYWVIKPATSGDELEMARFLNSGKVTISREGTSRDLGPTWVDVAHREIAILFAGTNIPSGEKSVEEGGDPLVKPDLGIEKIEAILREMPHAMIVEIWQAVARTNPGWGPKVLPPEGTPGD